jgi:hydrogenase maturation factor
MMVCTLIGEVERKCLVTPRGARTGDRLLLTKGVPVEATAILAREAPAALEAFLNTHEIERAKNFLHDPGISVVRDAQIAQASGEVHAMHDPTEGGLLGALWELAQASGKRLEVDLAAVPIPSLSRRICDGLGIDPFAAIASGALLLSASEADAGSIQSSLENAGIVCHTIGSIQEGEPTVVDLDGTPLLQPQRDEIARWFSSENC